MFNLLPKTDKDAVRREYRTRLLVVVLWFSFATFITASVVLLPSLFLSSGKEKSAAERFGVLSKDMKADEVQKLDSLLQSARDRLRLLHGSLPKLRFSELILGVAAEKNAQISLESFTLTPLPSGELQVTIAGVAADRNALVTFAKALEARGIFEEVELPLANLARDIDVRFSLRAKVI